jgi:tRNA dimethylallyltransferase
LRARLEAGADAHTLQYLHRVLRRLDPEAAMRIGPRDRPKMIRAIEVCLLTGRPQTELHKSGRAPLTGYNPIKIGLQPPRAALYGRIERRVQTMLDRGWLDEVGRLIHSGVPACAKPFDFIGYSELRAHLEGTITLAAARKAISQATRHYAKRQLTWFRKEPLVHWLPGFGDDPTIAASAEKLVAQELHSSAGT